jgi:Family of unknown function (DUF695)
MGLLNKIFGQQYHKLETYNDFWAWFVQNEKTFFNVVKKSGDIEKVFFNKLSEKLNEVIDECYYLTGMLNDTTVELIFTAEGKVKNLVFIEELVAAAPNVKGWQFVAHKPALNVKDVTIEMSGYEFNSDNLFFYANEIKNCPDEIDITVVYRHYVADKKDVISNGVFIFLDNFLGELNFVTTIDNLTVAGEQHVGVPLIPIEKLKDYLIWRQKEFIEKYEDTISDTSDNNYSLFEGQYSNGAKLLATLNMDLLQWDGKASHPWICTVDIQFDGSLHEGMPDENTYTLLEEIQQEIGAELKDADGYLNIGRETANGKREIYYACKEFRKPSKVIKKISKKYAARLPMDYDIYIDKYWLSFNRFMNQ